MTLHKPIKLFFQGEEECHDKEIDTLVDVPEEQCDLNPQTTCRFQTKLGRDHLFTSLSW